MSNLHDGAASHKRVLRHAHRTAVLLESKAVASSELPVRKKAKSLPSSDSEVEPPSQAPVPLLHRLPTTEATKRSPPPLENLNICERTPDFQATTSPRSCKRSRKRPANDRGSLDDRRGFLSPASEPFFDGDPYPIPGREPQPVLYSPDLEDKVHVRTVKNRIFDFESPIVSATKLHDTRKPNVGRPHRAYPHPSPSSSNTEDEPLSISPMISQPETRPITEEQLINEVRGIYAGLVMIEKKCVEIDQQQAQSNTRLTNEQWQALISLHRSLLYEHHDFFLASQHPSASPALRKLAAKYAMPARMWRHGIHSFLELLRHRLPDSLEHMLAFIYISYAMAALLVESVPTFEDTWIECLGDLARYRMAVEEVDLHDREIWAGVARYWYNKAADKTPTSGRMQHHMAVLSRPNLLQQCFYYTKSLVCVQPFPSARESILLLFNPILNSHGHGHGYGHGSRHLPVMVSFVHAHGILFTKGLIREFIFSVDEFISHLGSQINRVGAKWRDQGIQICSTNVASIFEYGDPEGIMMKLFLPAQVQTSQDRVKSAKEYWNMAHSPLQPEVPLDRDGAKFTLSMEKFLYASCFTFYTLSFVLKNIGDKKVLPHVHVSLAFIWTLTLVPEAMAYVEGEIPWQRLVTFLNTLNWQGLNEARLESEQFPATDQLPEDFFIRGQVWTQLYHPPGFFAHCTVDDEERFLEPPSITMPRTERCLWLGYRLASFDRWISFDRQLKQFFVKPLAVELEKSAKYPTIFGQASRSSGQTGNPMMDVPKPMVPV